MVAKMLPTDNSLNVIPASDNYEYIFISSSGVYILPASMPKLVAICENDELMHLDKDSSEFSWEFFNRFPKAVVLFFAAEVAEANDYGN